METSFLKALQAKVVEWREGGREGIQKETRNILGHIERMAFLHSPQIEALETYIYLKEIVGNKPTVEVFRGFFGNDKDLLLALGVSKDKAFDYIGNEDKINEVLREAFGDSDYANQVYALTMGSGKTVLMAVMMTYDFVLTFYHPEDKRFAKNALVFAPDTTIIESLKEIKTFDYTKVLPKEYETVMLNVKYHYLEDPKTPLSLIEGSNFNVVVSNSQKIIIKTRRVKMVGKVSLFADERVKEQEDVVNNRLRSIRSLSNLAVFVDEAHHSYGMTLDDELKKVKQTIEYLHGNSPLVGVINLTGTPYVNNIMMPDTVYHFGLKQGIEKGILKKVSFYKYDNVKDEAFVADVLESFWKQYGEKRLEGKLPKIAFYASAIADIQENLRPLIEKTLRKMKISTDKVLEYHTEAEASKEEFLKLDTAESDKQFVLLVGKGTEGWNCRSLVACALFRKPKSAIFVLQSSTRCLRSIGDNTTDASIYLSKENHKVLDNELRNNFATTIDELMGKKHETVEHTLQVQKTKRLTVKKEVRELKSVQRKKIEDIKIDLTKAESEKYVSLVTKGGIETNLLKEAEYKAAVEMGRILKQKGDMSFYEVLEFLNRRTHIDCLELKRLFVGNRVSPEKLVDAVNENKSVLYYLIDVLLANIYDYEETVQTVEEVIELTKNYPFKITIDANKQSLVIYREDHAGRLGFHINPYNFDSGDEKDIFLHMQGALEKDEAIVDIYFTGGVPIPSHNDFFFEYRDPAQDNRVAKYFPDFLIETTKGRYLVIEVKAGDEQTEYERNKREYGRDQSLFNTVFAKEVGFEDFRKHNKEFEYRVVFSTSLREWQKQLMDAMRLIQQ